MMKKEELTKKSFIIDSAFVYVINLILSVIFVSFYLKRGISIKTETFEKVLDSIITFSSITVGFIGTLLGIILSIEDTPLLKKLKDKKHLDVFLRTMRHNIYSGLFIVVVSCFLYLEKLKEMLIFKNVTLFNILVIVWFTSVVFLVLSTYRLTSIMMDLLLNKDNVYGINKYKPKKCTKEEQQNIIKNINEKSE